MTINSSFFRFLRTAPVVATIWFIITAFLLIEINHFYPDLLTFAQI